MILCLRALSLADYSNVLNETLYILELPKAAACFEYALHHLFIHRIARAFNKFALLVYAQTHGRTYRFLMIIILLFKLRWNQF